MVKATRSSAVLLGLTALGLCVSSIPAFAEVQDVKVGGDVTTRAFLRRNQDLTDEGVTRSTGNNSSDHDRFVQLTTGLNITGNLTQNVSAGLRLANETILGNKDTASRNSDLAVSHAWVKLKELFFSPLTVTLGRQPIVWGRGFVLGSSLIPGTVNSDDLHASIAANEFTDFTAFDAARAQLDFQGAAAVSMPLNLDLVYIKLSEGSVGVPDDINLVGFNLGTKLDAANSEAEVYYLLKHDRRNAAAAAVGGDLLNPSNLSTIGVRGSSAPIEGSSIYGELAYQFGVRATDPSGNLPAGDRQQAWAFDLGAEFTAKDIPTTPKIGAEWIFFSGKDVNGAVAGWDPIARGYFTTALREFQVSQSVTGFYPFNQACRTNGVADNDCTGAYTNQHQLSLYGSLKPLEDLTIAPRFSLFVLDEGAIPTNAGPGGSTSSNRHKFAGTEWDTQVTYNYTDDVQFGLIYALFAPGSMFRTPSDQVAQELITSVGVKF